MDKESLSLIVTIGQCCRLLKDHAKHLESQSVVKDVAHSHNFYSIDDFCRFEEYVDVQLFEDRNRCWFFEVTLTQEAIFVEADVLHNDDEGQHVLATIADCEFRVIADCTKRLVAITRELCASNPL